MLKTTDKTLHELWKKLRVGVKLELQTYASKNPNVTISSEHFTKAINHCVDQLGLKLDKPTLEIINQFANEEILGYGPIHSLMMDPTITDILINHFDEIYVEK